MVSTKHEPRCDECKFSRPYGTHDLLHCHRFPPTTLAIGDSINSIPTTVHPQFWCGEFASKFSPA